jgi:hypothetical protein
VARIEIEIGDVEFWTEDEFGVPNSAPTVLPADPNNPEVIAFETVNAPVQAVTEVIED